jgi:predicted RNase H-like nuclease (RuvC/YqgF family)
MDANMSQHQRDELACAMRACNQPKSRLLDVVSHLRSHGLEDAADALSRVIGDLEGWQSAANDWL